MSISPLYTPTSQTLPPSLSLTPPQSASTPVNNVPPQQGSPLHNAVKQVLAQHPNATQQDVTDGIVKVGGIDPQTATRVVSDVFAERAKPQPNSMGATPVAALANAQSAQQMAIDNPPNQQPTPSLTPPTQQSEPLQTEEPAPGVIPSMSPNGLTPPIVPGNTTPATSVKTAPSKPSLLHQIGSGLERFAPLAASLLIGKDNAEGGAAFLSSYDNAVNARKAQEIQQQQFNAQQTAKKAQDDRQNAIEEEKIKSTEDIASGKLNEKLSDDDRKALQGIPSGAAALGWYDAHHPNDEGKIRSQFIGPDGKPYESNPFSKDAARNDLLKQQYGDKIWQSFWNDAKAWSASPEQVKEIAASYDKRYGNGKTDFSDAVDGGVLPTDQQIDKNEQIKNAEKRTQIYADVAKARIDDITASAGLKRTQQGYIDAKTDEVVPLADAEIRMRDATADFLGARTGEVVPLAEADIAYKAALGTAATDNAFSTRERSDHYVAGGNSGGAPAQSKSGYASPWGKVYDDVTKQRDGVSDAIRKWRADSTKIDPNTGNHLPDPADLVEKVNRLDAQIERMNSSSPPTKQGPVTPGNTAGSSIIGPPQSRSSVGPALKLIGTKANTDNQPSCVDGVCKIASAVNLPVPKTRNAAEFEKELPDTGKGWQEIPVSQAGPNDIITSKGTGQSGRHVQWSLGNGNVLEADSRASGYSNVITRGKAPVNDPSAKAWRYGGSSSRGKVADSIKSSIRAKYGL